MIGILILIGLEFLLAAALYLGTGRHGPKTIVCLLAATAPLEVYRTTIAEMNVSLFRLSVAVAVMTFVLGGGSPSLRSWLSSPRRRVPLWRTPGSAIVISYVVLATLVLASIALNPASPFLGLRLAASIVIGVVVIVMLVAFARDLSTEQLLAIVATTAALPILAGCWQLIAFSRGWDPALPLLNQLPLAEGLEKSRDSAQLLGATGIRARATFGDSNHYGAYLICIVALAAGSFVVALLRRDSRGAVCGGALAAASCCAIVATYSRSAWLGCGAALVLALALSVPTLRTRVPRRVLLVGAASVVVMAIGVAPLTPTIRERFDSAASTTETSNRSHVESVEFASRTFGSNPLFGIGIGGIGQRLDQGPRTSGAHSSYLTTAAELGLPGLLALLFAGGAVLLVFLRYYKRTRGSSESAVALGLLAGYSGLLAANLVYDLWWDDFHWILVSLAVLVASRSGHATAAVYPAAPGSSDRPLSDERRDQTTAASAC